MFSIYEIIKNYKKISIIGMEKNVGKTTLLNKLIDEIGTKKIIGLTSIGRDGEEVDVVTETKKPRIFVRENTIIATARDCLRNCDITKEILEVTDFTSPMGKIIIVRARSAGYCDIAGPSYNKQVKYILKKMFEFGVDMTIVDGALGRKSTAIGDVADATILSTGASLSLDMLKVVEETKKTVNLLTLDEVDEKSKNLYFDILDRTRMALIYKDEKIIELSSNNSLDNVQELKQYLNKDLNTILVRGAITENLLNSLITNRILYEKIDLVALDGTRFFIKSEMLKKLPLSNIYLKVLNKINLLFVTINPWSPRGFEFNKDEFKKYMSDEIALPIINVKGDYNEIY